MKKKMIFQGVLLLLLIGGGIDYVMNLARPAKIQILCDIHPPRVFRNRNHPRANPEPRPWDVVFGLDNRYELKSLEIVPLAEWQTNKYALPVWHLVSESNSVPVKAIFYGAGIRGMHPAIKGSRPQPLETNVTYHLTVTATGSRDGECNFKLPVLPQTAGP